MSSVYLKNTVLGGAGERWEVDPGAELLASGAAHLADAHPLQRAAPREVSDKVQELPPPPTHNQQALRRTALAGN